MAGYKKKVFLACSGVGHIQRGYESHILDLYNQLKNSNGIDIFLIKGGGKSFGRIKRIYCIQRNSLFARIIQKIFRKPVYMVEQISFFIMSIYFIFLERPKTIYSPDFTLLRLYVILKKLSGSKYKTILCNGGNYKPPYYGIEIVQFILPQYADGIDFDNKVIIPHGFDCNKFIANKTKKQYRNDLGLPVEKKIILSVGAINCGVKRMDYLINEVAALTDTNLFLLIIGQKDEESKEIEKMATRKLGRNFEIRSVDYDTIQDYYLACDIFCLASLHETFGKVLIEAAICKLPVLVHDFEVSRMVLCEYAHYGNFAIVGNLSKLIDDLMKHCFEYDLDAASSLAKERFSWDRLSKQYVQMLS